MVYYRKLCKYCNSCTVEWCSVRNKKKSSFNFTFVTRDFLCSLLLLHCASFLLFKLLFSFFLMTFSVSTVQFSEFILFGGKQIILHFSRKLSGWFNMHIGCARI